MLIIEIQLWAHQPVGPTPAVGPLGGTGREIQVNTKNVLNRSECDPQSKPLPPDTGCENSLCLSSHTFIRKQYLISPKLARSVR